MTVPDIGTPKRSYGCTFGCGNPYDYILVSVADNSTDMLCLPCFIRVATDMVEALTNPESQDVKDALAKVGTVFHEQVPGPSGNRRGHNAPASADDDELFGAYEDIVTTDDLPEEFR